MENSVGRVALVWLSTLAFASTLLFASWGSGKREVYVLRAWVLQDAAASRWVPTGPLVASDESSSAYQSTLVLRPSARGAVLSGTVGDNLTQRPAFYDPATNRWALFQGALPSEAATPPLPAPPTAHHLVVSCGAGCALALPADPEAVVGAPVGLATPSAPVFLHEGAWRPFGALQAYFTLPVRAVRTSSRIVLFGWSVYFPTADSREESRARGWASPPHAAAWNELSPADFSFGDSSDIAATPSGALVIYDGETHGAGPVGAWVLPEGASGALASAPTVPDGTVAQAATLLSDGRLLAVGSTSEERTDALGLIDIARTLLVALAIPVAGIVLVRKKKLPLASLVIGVSLAVVTLAVGLLLLGSLISRGYH